MKIPPKKPHFFKPILPGFKNGLKIPIGFLKYLKGQEHIEHAALKRDGKKWLVKLNGQKLEEGNWGEFAEDFDLQVGNVLVFRHEGNMEFEVSIFDSTHCSREYPQYMHEDEDEYEVEEEDKDEVEEEEEDEYEVEEEEEDEYEVEEEEGDEYEVEEEEEDEDEVEEEERISTRWKKRRRTSMRWKKRRTRTRYVVEEEDEDEEVEEEEDKEEEEVATHDKPCEQSHFECTIRQYCLDRSVFFLPQQFALANGLTNKKCRLIVRDERQRSWKLKLCNSMNPRPRAYIGYGWRKFIAENCIKEGDRIKFEVVTNGKTPRWKFQVITDGETPVRKSQEKSSPSIKLSNETSSYPEAATNKPFVQSHFECIIREYCLSRGLLFLPKQFAFKNGLINKKCNLIIRDENQRSWNLKLSHWETEVFIGDGWRKFIADNCLKEGDRIKFEILTNGETQIWKFQISEAKTPLQKFQDIMRKSSNMSSLNAQVATSTSGDDDDHPYFVSTIKPYCISKTEFLFPMDFAKSNGLTNRKCEMILKDETERCWSVGLGRVGNKFGITSGWTKFRAANGIQVGDTYKFELIKNGEIPIAQFHYIMKKSSNMSTLNAQVSTSTSGDDDDHPYFVSIIKPYCISKREFHFPLDFAKSNGLTNRNCEMILKDETDRCWSVGLGRLGNRWGISSGWTKFRAENGIQVGDAYKFELIKNGEIPIAQFHCKNSGKVAKSMKQ